MEGEGERGTRNQKGDVCITILETREFLEERANENGVCMVTGRRSREIFDPNSPKDTQNRSSSVICFTISCRWRSAFPEEGV